MANWGGALCLPVLQMCKRRVCFAFESTKVAPKHIMVTNGFAMQTNSFNMDLGRAAFPHEGLEAYQAATHVYAEVVELARFLPGDAGFEADQLTRSALQALTQIAEASSKQPGAEEQRRCYREARGSTFATGAIIDALLVTRRVDDVRATNTKTALARVAQALSRLA
jgi:hypothetical protein